jgi:hypothetical protein
MSALKSAMTFVRWRVVPVRYLGKFTGQHGPSVPPQPRLSTTRIIEQDGHAPGPVMPANLLDAIRTQAQQRTGSVVPHTGGHPFVNLMQASDFTADNPVLKFAFSPDILDIADDYFRGRFILDSVQLLYSWPTETPEESQLWHRDFGDNRSLHCVVYLSDVPNDDAGPFTFVDKEDSRRMKRSPFIRRIDDRQFMAELGDGKIRRMLGKAGTSVWVDPSTCYHFGSRCRTPRLALFVTFNSDRPFVAATDLVRNNREALLASAKALRPDLEPSYLGRMLQA